VANDGHATIAANGNEDVRLVVDGSGAALLHDFAAPRLLWTLSDQSLFITL
jgi:hypothetical protein